MSKKSKNNRFCLQNAERPRTPLLRKTWIIAAMMDAKKKKMKKKTTKEDGKEEQQQQEEEEERVDNTLKDLDSGPTRIGQSSNGFKIRTAQCQDWQIYLGVSAGCLVRRMVEDLGIPKTPSTTHQGGEDCEPLWIGSSKGFVRSGGWRGGRIGRYI